MNDTELENYICAYGKDIYSFCCSLTRNRSEADDLYQDTFLKLLELGTDLNPQQNPRSFLLSIAVRIWNNRRRKYGWRQRITNGPASGLEEIPEIPSTEASPEQQMISEEETAAVQKAVRELPDKYRILVLLFYMEEQSISDIAAILSIPHGTVKSRLYKAKRILQSHIPLSSVIFIFE